MRAALAAALVALAGSALAAKPTERTKQKAVAEKSRENIREKLNALKQEISRTEAQKEDVADELAESEQAISDANRSLRELSEETAATSLKVKTLEEQRAQLAATVDAQKRQLARLLKEHYVAGSEDRIKLLLSGDNPNRINRDLQLMAYVSQAKARLLASLRANLAAVEANQQQALNAKTELEEIAQEEQQQKAQLERENAKRAQLLGTLSQKLVAQRKQAGTLERDEARLARLVDNLAVLIREQQAKAAADAKKRQEQQAARVAAAKAKAEAERLAKQNAAKPGARPTVPFKPTDPIDDVEAPKTAAVEEEVPQVTLAPAAPNGAFASLKGRMVSPVAGRIAARFGAKRGGEGPSWKGMFIKAAEGAEVRAVAQGRVVHASWMRGFGNLVIIDHGNDYLSIYGNNQSMLKREGDVVKAGDTIATAGNTGGNEESGLYFELRHLGRAFDPAAWVRF
ncbi:MAG TPA: peptidoglycan DD-metalloendopeptidase family protein [Telluria sp.]|nr:peptidoglycan DD-metalloendopeptidase family protein [Telluria sp.]